MYCPPPGSLHVSPTKIVFFFPCRTAVCINIYLVHFVYRYVIDLYEVEVPPKYRREIYEEPMRRAQVEVSEPAKLRSAIHYACDSPPTLPRRY